VRSTSEADAWSFVSACHQDDSHAAGRIRVIQARVSKDELACAAVTWKVDSWK